MDWELGWWKFWAYCKKGLYQAGQYTRSCQKESHSILYLLMSTIQYRVWLRVLKNSQRTIKIFQTQRGLGYKGDTIIWEGKYTNLCKRCSLVLKKEQSILISYLLKEFPFIFLTSFSPHFLWRTRYTTKALLQYHINHHHFYFLC